MNHQLGARVPAPPPRRFHEHWAGPRQVPPGPNAPSLKVQTTMLRNTLPTGIEQGPALRSALKRRQILDGARQVFIVNGYADASMEEITAEAGVSTGCVYRYFAGKDALFRAVVMAEAERIGRMTPSPDPSDPCPASNLRQIGAAVLEAFDSPATIATLRLIIGALGRFPRLGEEFLYVSLGPTVERTTAYLERCPSVASSRIPNNQALAKEFAERCVAQAMERVLVPSRPHRTAGEWSARAGELLLSLGVGPLTDRHT